jgi:hypothetical protein
MFYVIHNVDFNYRLELLCNLNNVTVKVKCNGKTTFFAAVLYEWEILSPTVQEGTNIEGV